MPTIPFYRTYKNTKALLFLLIKSGTLIIFTNYPEQEWREDLLSYSPLDLLNKAQKAYVGTHQQQVLAEEKVLP